MNLGSDLVFKQLLETLKNIYNMQILNLSHCSLNSKQLNLVAIELVVFTKLENLNISYNELGRNGKHDQQELEFTDELCRIVTENKVLMHIDISGMNLGSDYTHKIA